MFYFRKLFTLQAGVKLDQNTTDILDGAFFLPTAATHRLMKRKRMLLKTIGKKTAVLIDHDTPILKAQLEKLADATTTDQEKMAITAVPFSEKLHLVFYLRLKNPAVLKSIKLASRPRETDILKAIRGAKPVYHLSESELLNANKTLGSSDLTALIPPVISFDKAKVKEVSFREPLPIERIITPISYEQTLQFEFDKEPEGIYRFVFKEETGQEPVSIDQLVYYQPALLSRPPMAIIKISLPLGNYQPKDYTVQFVPKSVTVPA